DTLWGIGGHRLAAASTDSHGVAHIFYPLLKDCLAKVTAPGGPCAIDPIACSRKAVELNLGIKGICKTKLRKESYAALYCHYSDRFVAIWDDHVLHSRRMATSPADSGYYCFCGPIGRRPA